MKNLADKRRAEKKEEEEAGRRRVAATRRGESSLGKLKEFTNLSLAAIWEWFP